MEKETRQTIEESSFLDVGLTAEILKRGAELLSQGKSPERIAQKLAGDSLMKEDDYLKALPHYEEFGEVPEEVIRKNQILYLGISDHSEYLDKFRKLVSKYGKRFSDEDVKEKFVGELQNVHSRLLTGPANTKNHQSLVGLIEEETGVKFDRSLIRRAYLQALKNRYGLPLEHVYDNSNCERFKPRTQEECTLVNGFIEENVKADSLATPNYVHNILVITGVSPPYKLLLQVGRKKAQEVVAKRLHPGYMNEYAESVRSIGLPVLAEHLYKLSGIKYSEDRLSDKSQSLFRKTFVRKVMYYIFGRQRVR